MDILARAKELVPELTAHRRKLHQEPELGMTLPKTTAYVWAQLESMGYVPEWVGESIAVTAGREGAVFLLRADMDALPIHEETGLDFASQHPGCMHACGHDCHTAMLLGAARLLKEMEPSLKGRVRLLFQVGEEVLGGAKDAVQAGILTNPPVSAAMMIHVITGVPLPAGSLCIPKAGACYASADWYRVDVTGKGGHGAMPQTTISAVNTVCAINTAIQEIMAVVVPPSAECCMTVGELHAGEAGGGNVIPASAYLAGTLRTFDEEVRAKAKAALEQAATATAAARGAQAVVTYNHSAPAGLQDPTCRALTMEACTALVGREAVVDMTTLWGGAYAATNASEDFAYISEQVPSAIVWLAAGSPEKGYCWPSLPVEAAPVLFVRSVSIRSHYF